MQADKKVRRGMPRKKLEWSADHIQIGDFEVREIEGKYLVFLHGNVRAIRHTEKEAREYIAMVS